MGKKDSMTAQKPFWLEEAEKYNGQHEVHGAGQNKFFQRLIDVSDGKLDMHAAITDDDAYCMACLCGVLEMVGVQSPRTAWARDGLKWGVSVDVALGAIVIFERGTGGHAGIIAGRDTKGNYVVFGFNQRDMACYATFEPGRVLGFRWPADFQLPTETGLYSLPLLDSDGRVSTDER